MNDTRLYNINRLPHDGVNAMHDMLAALAPLMIALRRQAAPPLRFGAQRLHRMHVLVTDQQHPLKVPSPSDDLEQVLPRLSCWPAGAQARPVLGEILRGENGEWYERIGNRIRPLRQLVGGPHGEVLEVPNGLGANRISPSEPQQTDRADEVPEGEEPAASLPENRGPVPQSQAPAFTAFRRLLAEPGAWRVVPFGPFKSILAAQLAQPARLRDSHRLPCHLQVFEAIALQRMDMLARAVLGGAAPPGELQPLTPALVTQLELAPLLPAPPRVPPFVSDEGVVRPGQRFFRLTIANDPTAQAAFVAPLSPAPGGQPNPLPGETPQVNPPARATAVPPHLLRPWEFCRSREDAIARLLRANSWWMCLSRPFRRLVQRNSFRRWQLLLSGRSADEQLWCTPPPRSWLGDLWLRHWARHTLDLAGYDSAVMLSEWEIFWARKET